MKEPTLFQYVLLIASCLMLATIGLYLLANFGRLFRGRIRNELLRKNIAAWLIIFCLTTAISPMSGGFFYIIAKYGWIWAFTGQVIGTTLLTVFVFNLARLVAEHKKLKKLSFAKHNLLIFVTLVVVTAMVNLPLNYVLYDFQKQYLRYSLMSSIYLAGVTALVYAVINYLDIERKRKFDEKELELSRLRESKAKAELDALHSKVNPHFLYNALNSIADLALTDGKKARRMTIALADLFRYSINYSQNNFSTVNEEVAMTEVYLQIEKIRFEDQLNYAVEIEEELGHYLVPRFILQPLVENAVKHGLKVTGKMTQINLTVKMQNEVIKLVVADNGPPFSDMMMPGYGVKSVYDKMDLLFPGQYEIHFSNQPEKRVVILISKLMKNEPGI